MRVTPAMADDIEAVTDQWVALARSQREHGSTLLAEENREAVRDAIARAVVTGELLVARDDDTGDRADDGMENDRPVGFVGFSLEQGGLERDRTRGIIDNLFVDPSCRGEGVGSALLSAAERALREAGAATIGLEAMAANDRARAFYRDHGYEPHRIVLTKRIDTPD